MAFAEINIQEIIQEKKNNSEEFYNTWKKSEDEYRLIAEMIELRKQKGISQTQLARTIGNRQQVISRIEKKENSPSLKMFCCILDSLGYELKIVKKKLKQL